MATKNTEPDPLPQDAPKLPEIDEESIGDAADRTVEVPEEEAEKDSNVVRYIGTFSERQISTQDFEQAEVSDQEGAVWTKDSPTVPADHFSEEALRVLSTTGEFKIVLDQ